MRIVQIGSFTLDRSLIKGGVESSVYGLALEQARSLNVSVIDMPRLGTEDSVEEQDGLTIYRFRNPGPHNKDSIKRIEDIVDVISGLKPDVCHLHGTGIFGWKMFKVLKKAGIPVMLTVHGLASIEKKKALRQHFSFKSLYQYIIQSWCERSILSSLKTVIVDTKYVAHAIEAYHLRRTPRMAIIPQGIDKAYYDINCSAVSRTVLSVGSMSKRKGHDLLIQAFSIVAEKIKDISLVICGALADRSYYQALLSLAAGTHCSDRIFIKPNLRKDELYEQYSLAHIFALHTQEESQGIVFAEAMATGLPIVSTRVGGVPFVVTNGENGILVPYGDIDGFSQAIIKIMSLGDDWTTLSSNCRNKSHNYSWEVIARMIDNEYKLILES